MALMIPETLPMGPAQEADLFGQLKRHLPEEYSVWHGSALEVTDEERMPFLALAEFAGFVTLYPIVLPSSDTPHALNVLDRHLATARERYGKLLELLADSGESLQTLPDGKPPFGTHLVVVLMNLSAREIGNANLRAVAGDFLLLGKDELGQLASILESDSGNAPRLTSAQFNEIRCALSPSIEIRLRQRRARVVGGNWQQSSNGQSASAPLTLDLRQEQVVKSFLDLPEDHNGLTRDLDTRLVRGVAGSGKSLILLHRAHFLSMRFPSWNILVVTYTKALARFLEARYADFPEVSDNIQITNFHTWARSQLFSRMLWREPARETDRKGVIQNLVRQPTYSAWTLDAEYLLKEIDWITDLGISTLDDYLKIERRGRQQRLTGSQRQLVWSAREAYLRKLTEMHLTDWPTVATALTRAIDDGRVPKNQFDAILIDEAQDFAPAWFSILLKTLRPATNMLFMVADTTQKIYERPLSWRALGIELTGNRSRVLKRSYRNTYQILQAAQEVILGNTDVAQELKAEGDELLQPELNSLSMHRGPLPVLWWTKDQFAQVNGLIKEMTALRQSFDYEWDDFAILARTNAELKFIESQLCSRNIPCQIAKGPDLDLRRQDVKLVTLHSSKGLEFTTVFIIDLEQLQPRPGLETAEDLSEALAAERRLLYVAMTRARERLYLMHNGGLPLWLQESLKSVETRP